MGFDIGDRGSVLFTGLSGFWQRFFRDTEDLEAYYQASEIYLGQVYLDLMGAVLNMGIVDTPIFNKEYWRLFLIDETQLHFVEGASVAEDHYQFDMPGSIVSTDFLQNTIFDPSVVYERGVDFEVVSNDGYARFYSDLFHGVQDTTGEWVPSPGIGWRTIQKAVGHQLTDQQRTVAWDVDTDVKRGDTLRLLAQTGALLRTGVAGSIVSGVPTLFQDVGVGVCNEGDLIKVSGATGADAIFNGVYVVGRPDPLLPDQIPLEATFYLPAVSSAGPLNWSQYRAVYFAPYRDYEVDLLDKVYVVGSASNPYPIAITGSVVYAVVRDVADNRVLGATILPYTANADHVTDFGYKHLIPGTVQVYARTVGATHAAVEGVDYTIDYLRGRLYQLNPFDSTGVLTCDYQYRKEVLFAAGGAISSRTTSRVRQVSLWAPETYVDRFTLYYNYGSMLNRFAASSETYRAFLRGVIQLYVSGPVFERMESALNLAAGYPVVRFAGEVLSDYDDGITAQDVDGVLVAATNYFSTASYTFSILDVGGYIVLDNPVSDFNKGYFKILALVDANTVELGTSYGFQNEVGLTWVLTRTYLKTVTTDKSTYKYPYNVPIRADIQDPLSTGTLTFDAFEPLTAGFRVTDYVEDPQWWHNKTIPVTLWQDSVLRRYASDQLYEHVIGAPDGPCIGDPGYYIGADNEGTVFTPDDNLGNPVSLYRHCTAFILFDRYLKCHMFYVDIAPELALTSAFVRDLEELILVAKPSYTYPYVEPNNPLDELSILDDLFGYQVQNHYRDDVIGADNYLTIGDPDFPWSVGDYYRYQNLSTTVMGVIGVVDPTTPFVLPVAPTDRLLGVVLRATVGGDAVLEGRDYWVQWLVDAPDAWVVYPLTTWDVLLADLAVEMLVATLDNVGVTPVPSTMLGFTPIAVGGLNPMYVRRTALDPGSPTIAIEWSGLTQSVDRALAIFIDTGGGVDYTYLG